MNWVKENRELLNDRNYVLKATVRSGYWFGIWHKKISGYISRFGTNFNIILFGSEDSEGDFYVIPFAAIQDLLNEEAVYSFDVGKRWVGDIRNHILKFRNSSIERNISEFYSLPAYLNDTPILQINNKNDYAIENYKRMTQVRLKQSVFRQQILRNFNGRCCLTGLFENDLLVASHIIPWMNKIDSRLSPHNGLCLSILYDYLFDKGYFTFSNDYSVITTPRLSQLSGEVQSWLEYIDGKSMASPVEYEISKVSLTYHRENIFDKF